MDLNALKDRAYQNAVKHGWYEQSMAEHGEIMLIATELGEALNADRIGKYADRIMFEKNFDTPQTDPDGHWKFCYETFIKDTVEDELADTFIRILSYCGNWDIDIIPSFFNEDCMSMMQSFMEREQNFPEELFTVLFTIVQGRDDDMLTALVRMIALARTHDIDLFWHIEQKMKYNEMRPYKHGKKY